MRCQEAKLKLGRVRSFMQDRGLNALLLGRRDNFAWLTAGGDNHCASNSDLGVASILVTGDKQYVVTTNIEVDRIREEELGHLEGAGFEFLVYPWYRGIGDALEGVLKGRSPGTGHRLEGFGADFEFPGARMVYPDFISLRYPFTGSEVGRYRPLGKLAAGIVERACRSISPGMTELAIAGQVESALVAGGLTPGVILVGTDERIVRYRHPIPTAKRLERHCMVVVCAQRGGLTVALTRIMYFGTLPGDLRAKHDAVMKIDATMIARSRVGMKFSDVFEEGAKAYERAGYPGEWKGHHQGGPIGYRDREFLATPDTAVPILPNQAIAWNPSVPGTKSEDTILVGENGVEIITAGDTGWPVVEVEVDGLKVARPDILSV